VITANFIIPRMQALRLQYRGTSRRHFQVARGLSGTPSLAGAHGLFDDRIWRCELRWSEMGQQALGGLRRYQLKGLTVAMNRRVIRSCPM
jgi:hypothetical protein